jgi:hypothetical protein
MSTYDHIRCPICFIPWAEHSPDCPRHDHRPGAQAEVAPSVAVGDGVPTPVSLLRLFAARLEAIEDPPAPGMDPAHLPSRLVASAAAEIETLRNTVAAMTEALNTVHARNADLRAALGRIERAAVCPIDVHPDPWEWAVGRICSCTYFTRDEAVAGFRRRFGLEGGKD